MAMSVDVGALPALELQVSPLLVTFAELVELPLVELDERIGRELELNPALRRVDGSECDLCGAPTRGCPECRTARRPRDPAAVANALPLEAVEPTSLFRTALDDARGELTPAEQAIGEYILGSLDDRGFLSCGLDEAAQALGVAADRLAYVLHVLRGTGSPALGACDVRESLLLQLAHLEETGATYPLVRSLIADHLEALLRRGPSAVAASLGVTPADVHSALAFMRTHLRPIAAEVEPEPWARPAQAARQWPDVAIRVPEDPRLPVEVEVLGPGELCIDPTYRLASALTPNRHVLEFTRRAETFITLLQRRADVLRRIVARAANEQRAQVAGRGQPLGPRLTRAELARELGLHESTVTRAVANKLALLPDGRLQPLSEFFEQRHAVQDALRKLIGTETLPLTDAQLATHLATLGYRVARRTVAKYREALGIPAITVRS